MKLDADSRGILAGVTLRLRREASRGREKITVKVIDDRGNELMVVKGLDEADSER